mmetsp:Transcript_50057/g.117897  ORF Transcript_50057/g.117897 Transcript_50057/m.117897 type:complete len:240 (+) Transcript_50057:1114-1833(+)
MAASAALMVPLAWMSSARASWSSACFSEIASLRDDSDLAIPCANATMLALATSSLRAPDVILGAPLAGGLKSENSSYFQCVDSGLKLSAPSFCFSTLFFSSAASFVCAVAALFSCCSASSSRVLAASSAFRRCIVCSSAAIPVFRFVTCFVYSFALYPSTPPCFPACAMIDSASEMSARDCCSEAPFSTGCWVRPILTASSSALSPLVLNNRTASFMFASLLFHSSCPLRACLKPPAAR